MAVSVSKVRNPQPVPDLAREGTWVPAQPDADPKWPAKLPVHHRLFLHQTLTSARRDSRLHRPKVPQDSLDFVLSSVYEHDKDTLLPKKYVPMQPESLGRETWRVLRNEVKVYEDVPPRLGHPLALAPIPEPSVRVHPSSLKLALTGPHTDQTNAGYSRKVNGTFYGI